MSEEFLVREDQGGVTHLVINRPDKLNALNVEVFQALRDHLERIRDDDSVRCVILRGAGRCFSAGHDLDDISEGEDVPSPFWHSETLRLMETLPKPVIAAVHGHCYTGALEVALAADFIIASSNARFGDTHAKWALTPIWGMSQRLPRRVGIATAKRLMFTCEMIRAEEALRVGLCELVYPEESFLEEVAKLAADIVGNSGFTHAANKRLLEATESLPMDSGLLFEAMKTEGVGPDMQERVAAFLKK